MFSVNVDKLVKMTVKEAEDYSHTVDTIISRIKQEKSINVSQEMKISIGAYILPVFVTRLCHKNQRHNILKLDLMNKS